MFINSLALQAVIEAIGAANEQPPDDGPQEQNTPPAIFSSKIRDIHPRNAPYIKEVIEASRNLLKLAVENLHSAGALKHAPVRTHFRILSGAMLLLKSMAVGGKETEVLNSLILLNKTSNALREAVPDDAHISLRVGNLLRHITELIHKKLVRLRVPGRGRRVAQKRGSKAGIPMDEPRPDSSGAGLPDANMQELYANSRLDPPPFVDPGDKERAIMAPADFFSTSSANPDAFAHNPDILPPHAKPNSPSMAHHQATFLGSNGSPGMPPSEDSPISTGAYNWIAADFQDFFDGPSMSSSPFGVNTVSMQGSNPAGPLAPSVLPTEYHGPPTSTSRGGTNRAVYTGMDQPFTGGAFGPEIAQNVEQLVALGGWRAQGESGNARSYVAAQTTGRNSSERRNSGWSGHDGAGDASMAG